MDESHFKKLEAMYLSANINEQIFDTTQIEISEGKAEISLLIEDKYHHALGALHGSVYFKLMDDAAFFAVNSIVRDVFVLTTSFNIQLTRPVVSGRIVAKGSIEFESKNLFVATSRLFNENGKEVGFGTGNFMRSKVPLSEEIGYR